MRDSAMSALNTQYSALNDTACTYRFPGCSSAAGVCFLTADVPSLFSGHTGTDKDRSHPARRMLTPTDQRILS